MAFDSLLEQLDILFRSSSSSSLKAAAAGRGGVRSVLVARSLLRRASRSDFP
jgi:hypothetical protein